jgi:hypothetical protein
LAPPIPSHLFSTFPEITADEFDYQASIVARLGAIVIDETLTREKREATILQLHQESGCGTLEFRMLHMFALHAVQLARRQAVDERSVDLVGDD